MTEVLLLNLILLRRTLRPREIFKTHKSITITLSLLSFLIPEIQQGTHFSVSPSSKRDL